jgi:hypothetical protein
MIENKDGLFDLLGILETHILPAQPGDTLIIKVDEGTSEELMWAYGNKVKEMLPDCKILVLPRNVDINYFPEDYASRMIGMVK